MTAKNNSDFVNRHVGLNDFDIKKMLNRLNVKSLDDLSYNLLKNLNVSNEGIEIIKNTNIYKIMHSEISKFKAMIINYVNDNEDKIIDFLKTKLNPSIKCFFRFISKSAVKKSKTKKSKKDGGNGECPNREADFKTECPFLSKF